MERNERVERMAALLQHDDPNGCHTFGLWSLEWGDDRDEWMESVEQTFAEYLEGMSPEDAAQWRNIVR